MAPMIQVNTLRYKKVIYATKTPVSKNYIEDIGSTIEIMEEIRWKTEEKSRNNIRLGTWNV